MTSSGTAGKPASVLVVEDERLVALDLAETLQELGYEVVGVVSSAEEALEVVRSRRPDLALLDIRIGGLRDGIEVADVLRDEFQVPAIFLSAHTDDQTVERAAGVEPFGYLVKPFEARALRIAVEVALQRSRMEASRRASEQWAAAVLGALAEGMLGLGPTASAEERPPRRVLRVAMNGPTGPEAELRDEERGLVRTWTAANRVSLLYVLARRLEEDLDAGVAEPGWCNDAEVALGVWGRLGAGRNLNVTVTRIRNDLRAAGLDPWLIEKRPGFVRLQRVDVELVR